MAMAKLRHFILVAGLLFMAASNSNVAEARHQDSTLEFKASIHSDQKADQSSCFLVELILCNLAQGTVAFQLERNVGIESVMASEEAVAQTGQWTTMGPVEVSLEHPVVQVGVTVKAHKRSAPVKKVLQIKLLKYFGDGDVKVGRRAVLLTAVESWRLKSGKYLVIQIGTRRKVALSFKL